MSVAERNFSNLELLLSLKLLSVFSGVGLVFVFWCWFDIVCDQSLNPLHIDMPTLPD